MQHIVLNQKVCTDKKYKMQILQFGLSLRIYLGGITALLLSSHTVFAQKVKNIRTTFDQTRQLVFIDYDVKGLYNPFVMEVIPFLVASDSSRTRINATGADVVHTRNGKNKRIVWDYAKDGFNSFTGSRIELQKKIIERDSNQDIVRGLLLHGSNSAPLGLKWFAPRTGDSFVSYVGFRLGHLPPDYRYSVSNSGNINYQEPGIYRIGAETRLASYAVTLGSVVQVTRNTYIYIGGGYGIEQLFWQYQVFNLDGGITSTEWALNEQINIEGSVLEIGITAKFGRVLLETGVSSILTESSNRTYQFTTGIGYDINRF